MAKKKWQPADLEEIRAILEQRLQALLERAEATAPELQSTNPGALADPSDMAAYEFDQGFEIRIKERERKLIRKIRKALKRIEEGTYGICEECGERIGLERLRARPVTTMCIDCKEDQEFMEKLESGRK